MVQATDVVDSCDNTSSTSSVSWRSTPSTSPELTSTTHLAHHQPSITPAQSATDARLSSRRSVEDGGSHRDRERYVVPPRQTSTAASDPSRHGRPCPDLRGTGVAVAGDGDDVDVEDLSVVDSGIEDCLVTSLRAEVSTSSQPVAEQITMYTLMSIIIDNQVEKIDYFGDILAASHSFVLQKLDLTCSKSRHASVNI